MGRLWPSAPRCMQIPHCKANSRQTLHNDLISMHGTLPTIGPGGVSVSWDPNEPDVHTLLSVRHCAPRHNGALHARFITVLSMCVCVGGQWGGPNIGVKMQGMELCDYCDALYLRTSVSRGFFFVLGRAVNQVIQLKGFVMLSVLCPHFPASSALFNVCGFVLLTIICRTEALVVGTWRVNSHSRMACINMR